MTSLFFGKALLQRAVLALVAVSLGGCFDGGSSDDGGDINPQPVGEQPPAAQPTNRAPEVTGIPASTIVVGNMYSFLPSAKDDDGDLLGFTITNKPDWATFNDDNGMLTGVPGNSQIGETDEITITVSDGRDTRSIGPFTIRVSELPPPANNAPTITGTPPTTVQIGNAYNFQPRGADADTNDTLRYSISNRPSWATFNSGTGRLNGTPGAANVGTYANILISVNDGKTTTTLTAFTINVTALPNGAPSISGSPASSVQAAQAYTFLPAATDPEGDSLVYSINNLPRWASFSTASGRLSGTPATSDVGTYSNLVIRVSDGRASSTLPAFSIAVTSPASTNRTPTITGTPATTVNAGASYTFTPTARDPDGDSLGFTIQNRPTWASFDTSTGRLSGTAPSSGTFANIVITASDGRSSASLPAFQIRVNGSTTTPNRAPTISGTPTATVVAGSAYNFQPSATDADGDALTFSIQNAPSWAQFDRATGRLSGTPSAANVSTYSNIMISVSDGTVTTSLRAFTITVTASANGTAVLSWTPPTQNTDGSALTNLSGYRIVYGRTSTALDQTVQLSGTGTSSYAITGLGSGTWYFAVKAYTSAGGESDVSNVRSKVVQ